MENRTGIRSGRRLDGQRALVILFFAAAALQLIQIFWMNLTQQWIQDADAGMAFYHAVKMAENGTLVIPGWDYSTTGEWDCAVLFAAPLYGLTHNIFLSFGIANCLNTLLLAAVILSVFRRTGDRSWAGPLAVCLVLLPYSTGMLQYMNMMFYGASQYIYKALTAVWLISLLESGKRNRLFLFAETAAFLAMLFALTTSSGIYTFACAAAPVLGCRAVLRLTGAEKQGSRYPWVLFVLTAVTAVAGYLVHRMTGMETLADSMSLVTAGAVPDRIAQVFIDLLNLIWTFPEKAVSPLSLTALFHLGRVLLWIVIFGAVCRSGRGFMALDRICGADDGDACARRVRSELITVFFWNTLIVFLTDSKDRYHLIGFLPLLILAAMFLRHLSQNAVRKRAGVLLPLLALAWLAFMNAGLWRQVSYAVTDSVMVYMDEIHAAADGFGTDTIVFLDSTTPAWTAKAVDLDHTVATFENGRLTCNDDYRAKLDRAAYGDRHIMIVTETSSIHNLPEHLRQFYTQTGTIGDMCTVYGAEINRLDGETGPFGEFSVDYPYSPGYEWKGTVDARGFLHPTGDVVSPEFRTGNEKTEMRMFFENAGEGTCIRITRNGETEELPLTDGVFAVTFEPGTDFSFVIADGGQTGFAVDRIEFRQGV